MIQKLLNRFCWYHNTGGLLPQQRRILYPQLLRIALMLPESSSHNFATFQSISQLGPLSAVPTAGGFFTMGTVKVTLRTPLSLKRLISPWLVA